MYLLSIKNRAVKCFLFLFIFLSLCAAAFSYDFAGGTGEPNNPYRIATAEQLLSIGSDPNLLNKCYILLNDINLDPNVTGIPPFTQAPIAPDINNSNWEFDGTSFSGIFNGNGHTIINLIINTFGEGGDWVGLFGQISGADAKVINIGLEDVIIKSGYGSEVVGGLCGENSDGAISKCYSNGSITGDYGLGGLCGRNSGSIINSHTTGLVISGDNSMYVGGLCGFNVEGCIINCYSEAFVNGGNDSFFLGGLCGEAYFGSIIFNCYSCGPLIGGNNSEYLGGLCGENFGNISFSYATGSVNGGSYSKSLGGLCGNHFNFINDSYASGLVRGGNWSSYLGGLCGENNSGLVSDSNVFDCYSTGFVTGGENSQDIGGLCGKSISVNRIYNCFWDVNSSGTAKSAGGIGFTTEQMQTVLTFINTGWDFLGETANGTEDIWRMCVDGVSYPKLSWEFTSGDLICPDGVDFIDFAFFANFWLNSDCAAINNCSRSDFDLSGIVDSNDLNIFTSNWMQD